MRHAPEGKTPPNAMQHPQPAPLRQQLNHDTKKKTPTPKPNITQNPQQNFFQQINAWNMHLYKRTSIYLLYSVSPLLLTLQGLHQLNSRSPCKPRIIPGFWYIDKNPAPQKKMRYVDSMVALFCLQPRPRFRGQTTYEQTGIFSSSTNMVMFLFS